MSTGLTARFFALASTSPRRSELLGLSGAMFTLVAAPVNETPQPGETPEAFVRRMSRAKAEAAAGRLPSGSPALVVAADTVVVSEGRILGKPADAATAVDILSSLRGKIHAVLSAITVIDTVAGLTRTDLACTEVPMRDYDDDEIAAYVASGDPLDKAGAYAIQHAGFHPVEGLSGCYANVMGLPLCHLTRTLRQAGVALAENVPDACQAFTGYHCPVYQSILEGRL